MASTIAVVSERDEVRIPSGSFQMGDAFMEGVHADGESLPHRVALDAFSIDTTSVTNSQYAAFVKETGYRSVAEVLGNSAVFHMDYAGSPEDVIGHFGARWWLAVAGACWCRPFGAGSDIADRPDHPVVHVAYEDALAYCQWSGRQLPSEAQWEYAARGGLSGARYPWGDELTPGGEHRANIWQGNFPTHNDLDDGYANTAPVRTYQPNGYGLWQVVGNVWEWCEDWFSPDTYSQRPDACTNPLGPEYGQTRVMRGGSFLCHASYCNRYRVAARSSAPPDTSTGNLGFRTVAAP